MSKKQRHRTSRKSSTSRTSFWLWTAFLILCTASVGIIVVMAQTGTPNQASSSDTASTNAPHYRQDTTVRTLAFVAPGTLDSDKDHAQVSLIEGKLPTGTITRQVTVLSDENCTPDSNGISHCLNRLSIDGQVLMVRHNHKMAEVPCLQPGEVLQLVS